MKPCAATTMNAFQGEKGLVLNATVCTVHRFTAVIMYKLFDERTAGGAQRRSNKRASLTYQLPSHLCDDVGLE